MNNSKQLPVGGEGYQRIFAQSPRDARFYLWSERLAMVAGVGLVIALGFAVFWPLVELLRGTWRGFGHYLVGIIVVPLPFFVVLFASARLHRRVARRHGLLSQ